DINYAKQVVKNFRNIEISDDKALDFLNDSSIILHVALDGDTVIAYLLTYRLKRLDSDNVMLHPYHLFVSDRYQKQGIGKKMIETIKEYAQNNKTHYMYLITQTDNMNARNLYEKLGGYNHPDNHEVYYWYYEGQPKI
ncbi:MAG: GNAT family N-acetyltransferase, partial [Erysipelotrichaceae bacterium]